MPHRRFAAIVPILALALVAAPRPAEAQRGKKGERASGLEPRPFKGQAAGSGRISGLRPKNQETALFRLAQPIRYTAGSAAEEIYPSSLPKQRTLYSTTSSYEGRADLYRAPSNAPRTSYYPDRPEYKTYAFGFGAAYVPVGSKIAPRKTAVTRAKPPIAAPSLLRPPPGTKPKLTVEQSMSLLRPQIPGSAVPVKGRKKGG